MPRTEGHLLVDGYLKKQTFNISLSKVKLLFKLWMVYYPVTTQ